MARARWMPVAAAIALLAACNGNDDTTASTIATTAQLATSSAAPTTDGVGLTTAVTSPTSVTSTSARPTTTATTGVSTTVAGPTTVPSTTVPPTSTSVPISDEEQALAVIEGAYRVWIECLESVAACDTSTFNAYVTHPQLGGDQETIAEYKANGYEVDNASSLSYEVLEMDLEFTIPYAVVCERDQSTVVQRRPGEPELIIEQNDVEQVREIHLVKTPLGWRVEGFATRDGETCE